MISFLVAFKTLLVTHSERAQKQRSGQEVDLNQERSNGAHDKQGALSSFREEGDEDSHGNNALFL
jgi:hypothetical protein